MKTFRSHRLWLAACAVCVAATASAQQPQSTVIPPPKFDYPISANPSTAAPPLVLPKALAPVERIGGDAIPESLKIPDAPSRAILAETPKLPDAPDGTATKEAPMVIMDTTPSIVTATDANCTATAGKMKHEKCEYTKYGNIRTCKIPATIPLENGAVVRSIFERQKQLALAEYFVVYREDFLTGTSVLNATGLRHVEGIYKRLSMIPDNVRVEPTGNAKLDQNRREAVIKALIQLGAPSEISMRVGSGTTRAEGLRYEDVPTVGSANPLTGSGGGSGGAGGGGGGGFGLSGGGGIGGFGFR